jgi:hypothetical protein
MVKLSDLQKHELREWSDEVEDILRTLSEKAQIWRLLHMKNHDIFKRKYYWLIIPVTILSSITGAANLALGSVASGNETSINLVIGALGIVISVISTLNNIFSFQRRKDEHYRSSKDWYRVQRMIDVELSLQRNKRNNVSVFFHLVLQEVERIHEFHPNIRDDVIKKFMKSYKNKKLTIDVPEILTIRKTLIFKDDINNEILVEPQHVHNVHNVHNVHKKPSYNRQGTFINIDDNSDNSDKSYSNEPSLLVTNTHTPEIPKREKINSFMYIGDTISKYTKQNQSITEEKENDKTEEKENDNIIVTPTKHTNSPNISITVLATSKTKIYDDLEEHEHYPFEIHDDNLEMDYIHQNNNDNNDVNDSNNDSNNDNKV